MAWHDIASHGMTSHRIAWRRMAQKAYDAFPKLA
jgi:hypothetical protein